MNWLAWSPRRSGRHGEGVALTGLGLALRETGRFKEAITACQDAAAIVREADDRHLEAMTMGNIAATRAAQRA